MSKVVDGIYAAFMTGTEGQGFGMFAFLNGQIFGADPLGVRFGGTYSVGEDNRITGTVRVEVPPNGTVIQGVSTGNTGFAYEVPIEFSSDFADIPFIAINTPLGPINVKLEKLRAF